MAPPVRAADSSWRMVTAQSKFASWTRALSPGIRSGSPQAKRPRHRTGRGPGPRRKRARDQVEHGLAFM
eukprot:13717257-Alexandrium_andersonii.AAC.1